MVELTSASTMSQNNGKVDSVAQSRPQSSPNEKADVGEPGISDSQQEQDKQSVEKQEHGGGEHGNIPPIDTNEFKPGPSGGFDSTPIPQAPRGYTLKITIHRAENLPMADIHGFSSDPYCLSQLNTHTPMRHKEDPPLRWRSPTVRKNIEPEWNDEWIVANVPASGFKLKIRIYDEDPADSDDLLGKVHISIPSLDESWQGFRNESYKLLTHDGSKRAYLLQALTTCVRRDKSFRGRLWLSIEMLGRTEEDGQNGRLYTIGPCRWIRHYSPILGRLANIKEPGDRDAQQGQDGSEQTKKVETYNFQANQVQLQGPVPAQLYHRYVEFKPWVSRMFTSSGLSGVLMGKALHHQHARVYNFARSTLWGFFPQGPCLEMTKKFLDLVHWDQGGRIFTYVITLDALFRFTETGKEFSIDMLSKHTMHSDVSIYIAFSGEFFIRRLKHGNRHPPPEPVESSSQSPRPPHEGNVGHASERVSGGPPDEEAPREPKDYQLVIDNDSGTYRPNADLLPLLQKYLGEQLPGLQILTLDCNKDSERQQRMKKEQRERKKREGEHIVYRQGSRSSSISSSDVEGLDLLEQTAWQEEGEGGESREGHGIVGQAARDGKLKNQAKLEKLKREYVPGGAREVERERNSSS